MTNQLNVRVSAITRRQAEGIAKREGMSLGAVVALGIERLHAQLSDEWDQAEEIRAIRYGFHAADLLTDDSEKYDTRASVDRYIKQVEAALREAYPDAEVEIVTSFGTTGDLPEDLKTAVDMGDGIWQTDPDAVEAIEFIARNVWMSFKMISDKLSDRTLLRLRAHAVDRIVEKQAVMSQHDPGTSHHTRAAREEQVAWNEINQIDRILEERYGEKTF